MEQKVAQALEACKKCVEACLACAEGCSSQEGMESCARKDRECADVCTTTVTLLERFSEINPEEMKAQLQDCVASCRECAEDCEQHADNHEHCRVCAEACRRCEAACAELLASL